jgi:hypothetical protein
MVLDSNGYDVPQTGGFAHVTVHDWNTLIIAEHEAYSAWLFLYDHGPRDSDNNLDTRLAHNGGTFIASLSTMKTGRNAMWILEASQLPYPTSYGAFSHTGRQNGYGLR